MKSAGFDSTHQARIYAQSCRRMAELVPGWSDAVPSDPAVAILELASCLSDMQNYKWNVVGPEHYLAYVRLLGGVPEALAPASLLARPLTPNRPYAGQRFWVDGVPYEVTDAAAGAGDIQSVTTVYGEVRKPWQAGAQLLLEGAGESISISFSRPLAAGRPYRIWCGLAPQPGRAPPDDETPPPVKLRARISDGPGWREIPLLDGTCGLLRSGFWTVTPDLPASVLRVAAEGRLEGRPGISEVVLEPVRLEQRLTRSAVAELQPPFLLPEGWMGNRVLRCFVPAEPGGWREAPELFARDGRIAGWSSAAPGVIRVVSAEPDFPFSYRLQSVACEEVLLEEPGILPDSLRLMVQEGGVWYDCPIREPDPGQTLPRGCRWDGERQRLRFGDGRDFRVPAGGELLVAACAATLGSKGNGAAGLLAQGGLRLQILAPAAGGRDPETARDAFFRTVREQEEPLRAVTAQDYELLARRTPGLALGQVRAISQRTQGRREAGITVLAKPVSGEALPMLTPWQAGRLQSWLNRFRLIGIPVAVRSPRYLPLSVSVSLRVSEPVEDQTVREAVLPLTDGVTGPLDFGGEVSYAALFAALGALEHVTAVTALELRPLSGGARRAQDGTIFLKPDMLPYLKELRITQV